jgi:hypothetical protein
MLRREGLGSSRRVSQHGVDPSPNELQINFSGSPLASWDRNHETHGTAQSGTKNGVVGTRTDTIHNKESRDTGHVVVTGGTETRIYHELFVSDMKPSLQLDMRNMLASLLPRISLLHVYRPNRNAARAKRNTT